MQISPLAGQPAPVSMLVDIAKLVTAYYSGVPDPSVAGQRVAFGTSGHRGSSFELSFNEHHVLAITQAICDHRRQQGIHGPLFLGIDTHALSQPAATSALEVLAANGVHAMLAEGDGYTPTPAISHAILTHNRGLAADAAARADGIVVTPSHNPPDSGGFKYNPPHGGPADQQVTGWIEAAANTLLEQRLAGLKRIGTAQALRADTTHRHDYLGAYVDDLANVIDMATIRDAGLRIGVDPLGGAGVHYWPRIAEQYRLDLTVVNEVVDATFRFMTLDWDGRIRMDPSSPFAMQRLLDIKDRFDIAFACDTDHDRHGIVTGPGGLLPPNHYLSVMVDDLFQHRPHWPAQAAVGKTVVSTRLIDLVAQALGRRLYEVPVGFKWFAAGLLEAGLGFAGEESAGATFLRRDGRVWTTDKDGLVPALLAAEMTARRGRDPGALYGELARRHGSPVADRVEAPANPRQKARLASLSRQRIEASELAGEAITTVIDRAPGNGAAIGGIKVVTASGWFAARPSGTEDIYKIYAESFSGEAHLKRILTEAQAVVDHAIAGPDDGAAPA
jgi:phosphoglucomutase